MGEHLGENPGGRPKKFRSDRLQVNEFHASIGRQFDPVDQFVAVKASNINRLQQRSISSGFRIAESKGLPRRVSG